MTTAVSGTRCSYSITVRRPLVTLTSDNDVVVDAGAECQGALIESCRIDEGNIVKENVGKGAFGEVWSGRLLLDIKILVAGMVDEDGDPIDPSADKDFHKECDALQRVDTYF